MGRKSKCNDELIATIETAAKKGVPAIVAVRAQGIHESTYYRWLEKGEEAQSSGEVDSVYAKFARAVSSGEAAFESELIETLYTYRDSKGRPDLRTVRWLLERRSPQRFASPTVQRLVPGMQEEMVRSFLKMLECRVSPHTFEEVLEALGDAEE